MQGFPGQPLLVLPRPTPARPAALRRFAPLGPDRPGSESFGSLVLLAEPSRRWHYRIGASCHGPTPPRPASKAPRPRGDPSARHCIRPSRCGGRGGPGQALAVRPGARLRKGSRGRKWPSPPRSAPPSAEDGVSATFDRSGGFCQSKAAAAPLAGRTRARLGSSTPLPPTFLPPHPARPSSLSHGL